MKVANTVYAGMAHSHTIHDQLYSWTCRIVATFFWLLRGSTLYVVRV